MFVQIKITSENNGFLPSYDFHHRDQLLKPYEGLVQLLGEFRGKSIKY